MLLSLIDLAVLESKNNTKNNEKTFQTSKKVKKKLNCKLKKKLSLEGNISCPFHFINAYHISSRFSDCVLLLPNFCHKAYFVEIMCQVFIQVQ